MASVTLTKDQADVVGRIARWARDPGGAPHFTLAGYAGTGKTTIIRSVIEASDRKVRCCTPTGKAAA